VAIILTNVLDKIEMGK